MNSFFILQYSLSKIRMAFLESKLLLRNVCMLENKYHGIKYRSISDTHSMNAFNNSTLN